MARSLVPPPQRPILTVEQKRRGIARLLRRVHDLEAFDPQRVRKRFADPNVMALETAIDEALSAIFGHGTVEYNRYRRASTLDHGGVTMSFGPAFGGTGEHRNDAHLARQYIAEGKLEAISLLRQAIRTLTEEIEEQEREASPPPDCENAPPRNMSKVFVVHGHDVGAHQTMARFLERIDLEAITLQEQPDKGLTIIEKFETYADQVSFAVVLLTPDDIGGLASGSAQVTRARQNVIFELGYFVGKLGRGRVCVLRKREVEIPSDLYGVIYTEMDENEGWKFKLARELKAVGLKFDTDKVL